MAERWQRLLASQGMREHLPWLTRAYFVSYTAGQILPTSIGGDAVRIVETSRRHPARLGAISRDRPARACARRRGDGPARRVRLPARDRPLRRRCVPLDRGRLRLRDDPAHLPLLLALRPAAAAPDGAAAAGRAARAADPRRSTTASTPSATAPACWSALRLHRRPSRPCASSRSGPRPSAVGIDLPPRIYFVMGPLFFLVLLSRSRSTASPSARRSSSASSAASASAPTRRSRPASSSSSSPSCWRCPAARSCSGKGCGERPSARPCLTRRVVVVTHNALPWIERCLESVRGEETSSSTTAPATARVDVVREQLPEARVVEQENLGLAAGWNRGMAEASRPLLPDPERRCVADGRLAAAARRLRRPAAGRGGRRAAAAQPRRLAAAVGARLPDALAARDRVLLPAQARPALARAERVLRGRVRPPARCARRSS